MIVFKIIVPTAGTYITIARKMIYVDPALARFALNVHFG